MARPFTYSTEEERKAARKAVYTRYHAKLSVKQRRKVWASQKPKEYFRNIRLKHYFGITLDEYNKLFELQGKRCAACGSLDPMHKNGWRIDHDHNTGKIRGILCNSCNIIEGFIKNDHARLIGLNNYLGFSPIDNFNPAVILSLPG